MIDSSSVPNSDSTPPIDSGFHQEPGVAHTPWTLIHERKIAQVAATRNLKQTGLTNRESVTAFPDGHLVLWDISGFTEIMKHLDPERQVLFVQDIIHQAVQMALDLDLVMLAPPAGDQGIYFAPQGRGKADSPMLVSYIQNQLRITHPLKPGEFCEVKAVVLPASQNSLFGVTLLDQEREGGVTRGFHAVAGEAYAKGLHLLQFAPKKSTRALSTPVPGLEARFEPFDFERREQGTLGEAERAAVREISFPNIPKGPHHHGVLKPKGDLGLLDPLDTVHVGATIFQALGGTPGVRIQRQDEGAIHVTVEEGPQASQIIAHLVQSVSAELNSLGTQLKAQWSFVPRAHRVEYGPMRDGVGGVLPALVHELKGKEPKRKVA